jgi:hypothetical protein
MWHKADNAFRGYSVIYISICFKCDSLLLTFVRLVNEHNQDTRQCHRGTKVVVVGKGVGNELIEMTQYQRQVEGMDGVEVSPTDDARCWRIYFMPSVRRLKSAFGCY